MDRVIVSAVGDVYHGTEPLESAFENVLEPLRSADVRFAQAERVYARRGRLEAQAGAMQKMQDPSMAEAFKKVPFDVLSIASNHTGDYGAEAVEDNLETFRLLGIHTVGAGRNIEEARKPAIITRNSLRIAFLGYVSVIPPQTWATETRAGSAPMRAHTYYEPYEYQAGAPPRVVTAPHAGDLEHLVADVRRAKQDADFVFVSLHWGLHYVPRPCDYQPLVAHAAIEAGACAILGHHAHQPQGIELYKSGVIFYSIGNFSLYGERGATGAGKGANYCLPNREYTHDEVYSVEPEPGVVFHYKRHFSEGGIAFIEVDRRGISRVSYLPTLMNSTGQPQVVRPEHPQFEKSLMYLNWAGKFIDGGVTNMKALGDRYEVFARPSF